jgi:hypothetical protein
MYLQLADGVGLAIRFVIVGDFWKSNSSEIFHEVGPWWRSPRRHRPECFGVLVGFEVLTAVSMKMAVFFLVSSFSPPNGRLTPAVRGGGGFQNGSYAPNKHTTAKVREYKSDR